MILKDHRDDSSIQGLSLIDYEIYTCQATDIENKQNSETWNMMDECHDVLILPVKTRNLVNSRHAHFN